jgi:multiple sugar transport system substrate-binding protein
LILIAALATGCGQGNSATEAPASSSTASSANLAAAGPIELSVYQTSANISDEEFERLMVEPVKRKYPNITLQLIHTAPDKKPEQLVASGTLPDLIFGSQISVEVLSDLDAVLDLTPYLKKDNVNADAFDAVAMDAIRARSPKNQLLALPFSLNFGLLYYNKDIFDQLAVPYPKSGMTWEEAVQLGAKVTRTVGGTQYRGINVDAGFSRLGGQLSLPTVDPQSNKPLLSSEGWKRVFDVKKMMSDIPGNTGGPAAKDAFLKDRSLAMLISPGARVGEIEEMFQQGNAMNWGIASLPSFKEAPGKGFGPDTHLLMISNKSKYKDAAFSIIALLSSEAAQTEMNKGGRLSGLKDKKTRTGFGANLKSMKDVDAGPIINYVTAQEAPWSQYYELAKKQVEPALNKAVSGSVDINTALREADELASKAIAEEINGNK